MVKNLDDQRFNAAVDKTVRRIIENAVASCVDTFTTSKNLMHIPEFHATVLELVEDKLQATHSAESLKLLIAPVVDKEVTMALSNAVSRVVTHTIDEARKALEHQRRVISVGNKVEPIRNVSVRAWHMLELVLSGKTVYAAADAVNVSHNDAVATVKSAIAAVVCFVNATNVDPSLGDELRDTSRSISNLRDDKRARELWVSTLSRLRELGVVVSPARKVISHHEGNQP